MGYGTALLFGFICGDLSFMSHQHRQGEAFHTHDSSIDHRHIS
jgi:hypothetical protein